MLTTRSFQSLEYTERMEKREIGKRKLGEKRVDGGRGSFKFEGSVVAYKPSSSVPSVISSDQRERVVNILKALTRWVELLQWATEFKQRGVEEK